MKNTVDPSIVERWNRLFLEAITRFDGATARKLIQEAFRWLSPEDVCLLMLQPSLYHIGTLWHEQQLSWVNENLASTIIREEVLLRFESLPHPQGGQPLFLSGVPQETHLIGLLFLALFWRGSGLNVFYNQKIFPTNESLLQEIQQRQPAVVCLSAMTYHRAKSLPPLSLELRRFTPSPPLLCYGGGAFLQNSPLQQQIRGFYLGPNAAIATQNIRTLLQQAKFK